MKKLKYVRLFENFQVNEGIMDIFKSKATKVKEANLVETQKRVDEFKTLLQSVRRYFPKSLKSLEHNRYLYKYYSEVAYNTNITNKTSDSIYALLYDKGIGTAWKVGISILNQLEKSNRDYPYNIGLQNVILNYSSQKSKGGGDEKTYESGIKSAGTFINSIRYFLEIIKSLEEKYPVSSDSQFLKDLKIELSDRVETILKETDPVSGSENKDETLWIWNWIKTGKEPMPIIEVMKK